MSDPLVLQTVFSRNRAEELGTDVWEQFVVPPFFDRVRLGISRKPSLIVGGRGCGKTMLLRYLSHHTVFSPKRKDIPDSSLLNIALYWRADTQFANAMLGRGVPEDVWASAFNHMAALMLSLELISCIDNVVRSCHSAVQSHDLSVLEFSRMSAFDPELPKSFERMASALQSHLWEFESWVNNSRTSPAPRFYPGPHFVTALLKIIQDQLPALRSTCFYAYMDEYENLCPYQQRIVNTWVKHSTPPLIFNLAMKRHGMETRETTGPESLSDIHDFREHDLEQYILERDDDFRVFAAEILFLLLSQANMEGAVANAATLRDPQYLPDRRQESYRKLILTRAARLFPEPTSDDVAREIMGDRGLRNRLRERTQQALVRRGSTLNSDAFLNHEASKAAIVMPPLLNRSTVSPETVLEELELYKSNVDSKFDDWVHNNFFAAVLQLYAPESRACPLYSGFSTFCHLAHGNIRYLLELCHKSIYRALDRDCFVDGIPPPLQAEASKQTSTAFLAEVKSFGRRGNQLHGFVLRLGSLFQLAHARPTLSEPEQNHFSVTEGSLLDEDYAILREATKWSVLFDEAGTKKKQDYQAESIDYILAPIYSPYFHISYRKKRKIELTADDLRVLYFGKGEAVEELLRKFKKRWNIGDEELPPLFSALGSADSPA
jgi:hypothetical protein